MLLKGFTWVAKVVAVTLSQFKVLHVNFFRNFMCRVVIVLKLSCVCSLACQIFRKNIVRLAYKYIVSHAIPIVFNSYCYTAS